MNKQYHFLYREDKPQSYADQSKVFLHRLRKVDSEVVKDTHRFGKTLALDLAPTYFLSPRGGGSALFDADKPYSKPTLFTEIEWYKNHNLVKSTKERYHPAYKGLCPVLRNAPLNPVPMTERNGMISTTYISRMFFTQFKDGTNCYEFETRRARINNDQLIIEPSAIFSLTFDPMPAHHHYRHSAPTKHSGLLKVDGVVSTKVDDLIRLTSLLNDQFLYKNGYSFHKSYVVLHRLIDGDLSYWLSSRSLGYEKHTLSQMLREWHSQLKAMPELYDLPFSEIELLNLVNDAKYGWYKTPELRDGLHESILEPLRAGDTKKAVDACFFGFSYPKSIRKLLLKAGLLTYPKYVYAAIDNCVKSVGIDKTLTFLSDVHHKGEPDLSIINNVTLIEALGAGFNIDVVKQIQRRGVSKKIDALVYEKISFIKDTMLMYERLVMDDVELDITSNNIVHVHNYLSNLYTFHINTSSSAQMRAMKAIDTSDQSPYYEAGEYIIRSPYTAAELVDVGIAMSHCVASYIPRFYYRQLDIVLLTNKAGEYLACIEIFKSYVTQAKLKHNKRLCTHADYHAVVSDYVAKNKFIPASLDMGDSGARHKIAGELLPPHDEHREQAIQFFALDDD